MYSSTIQFGTQPNSTNASQELSIAQLPTRSCHSQSTLSENTTGNPVNDDRPERKEYDGEIEDNEWFSCVTVENDQSQEEIYQSLLENMGVFKWQNAFGYSQGDNRELAHYKPLFKNIKELGLDALQNFFDEC